MDLATIQIKVDTRQVKAANEDIKQLGTTGQMTSKKVNAANDDMAKSAKSTTSAFKLLGGAMAALGVGALVSNFARTVTESERLKGSLKTMTGSTEDAAFAFSELEKFASQTPFTLDQSVEGFIKLKALGLDPSERALRSYGNTSAAMGKDMMQMIEAVADASTGEFERLKEFGIKASKQGDDVSLTFQGVTTTIGNSSAEIQNYLLEIGETKFGTAMEDQMKALPGLLSNLSDNVSALFRKIGDVGGINIFAAAITGASSLILGITNNLEALTIGVGAALAGFVAFTIGSNATRILGGFKAMRVSVLALNTAIKANPIGLISAAIAVAAVAIISNFDKIKAAAERAAIRIQIGFEKLNIFLLEAVGGALNSIMDMFTGVQNRAVATMAAVAAAVKNPTDAFDTFNETYSTTLEGLQTGNTRTNIYSDSIARSRDRVDELNGKLASMNTEVSLADTNYQDADRSLSDYAIQIDESAVAANELAAETEAARTKTLELLGEISNETEALNMSNVEIAVRNNLQKAGVDATSELGEQIVAATEKLYAEKAAIDAANESAKALEKQHDESQKAIEKEAKRVAEEQSKAYEEMKNNISGFFMDLFENGRDAFDNIAKTFKNMILQMLADWAASKIADIMTATFSGIGTSISGMFSGIFSSISSSIGSLASRAASVLTGGAIGGGAAAAGSAAAGSAIAAGTSTMAANAAVGAAATGGGAAAAGGAAAGGGGVGATVAAGLAKAGAAVSSAASSALAFLGPGGIALLAGGALASVLDSGGTPTSTAGLTMAKTGGMSDDNIFQMDAFESGFAPLGFKQNATNAQAEASVKPLREIDAALTALTKEAGFDVNLSGHTFSGLGVEGSGPGTVLGTFVEEGKEKGTTIEKQMDNYAAEWVKAVGARNGISDQALNEIIGDGTASTIMDNVASEMGRIVLADKSRTLQDKVQTTGMDLVDLLTMNTGQDAVNAAAENATASVEAAEQAITTLTTGINTLTVSGANNDAITLTGGSNTINAQSPSNMGPQQYPQMGPIPGHRDGLNMVPYDGYVAELHAGERVQTAEQARASDSCSGRDERTTPEYRRRNDRSGEKHFEALSTQRPLGQERFAASEGIR